MSTQVNPERTGRCFDTSDETAGDEEDPASVPSLSFVEQGWSAHYSPANGVGPDVQVITHAPRSESGVDETEIVAGPLKASRTTRLADEDGSLITIVTVQRLTDSGFVVLFRQRERMATSPVSRTVSRSPSAVMEQTSTGDLEAVSGYLKEVATLFGSSPDALLQALTSLPGGEFLSQFG